MNFDLEVLDILVKFAAVYCSSPRDERRNFYDRLTYWN